MEEERWEDVHQGLGGNFHKLIGYNGIILLQICNQIGFLGP